MQKPRRAWRIGIWLRLLLAGWRPGRNVWKKVTIPNGASIFPEAQRVLSEFGKLKFGNKHDDNVVIIGPLVKANLLDSIKHLQGMLKTQLYPIAIWGSVDETYILIDEKGIVYKLHFCPTSSSTSYWLTPFASSFEQSLTYLLPCTEPQEEIKADLRSAGIDFKEWEYEGAPLAS